MRFRTVRIYGLAPAGPLSKKSAIFRVLVVGQITDAALAGVTKDPVFLPMQQLLHHSQVVGIGCGGAQAVNQPQRVVNSDMPLYLKEPLLAVARLMHLRTILSLLVMCLAGRVNDAGIDDRALPKYQPLLLQID